MVGDALRNNNVEYRGLTAIECVKGREETDVLVCW